MQRMSFFLAAALLVSAFAHAGGSKMVNAQELFDRIDAVATGTAFSAAALSRQLGVKLAPVPDRSDDYSLIYTGTGNGLFADAELRLPGPASNNPSQLAQFTVAEPTCATMRDAQGRYGEGALSVPTPRQPPDAPLYLVYTRDWGKLSLGFDRRGDQCLRRIVIDVQKPT